MNCSRQEMVLGKHDLGRKTAAIIGLGAIGTNTANLLARSGLSLILIDFDNVEEPNINSQSIYTKKDLKKSKAEALTGPLKEINPRIKYFNIRIGKNNLNKTKSDIVLDCTDNLETRFLLNDYCKEKNIPLIHSAAIKTFGTVFVSYNRPCLRCIYKDTAVNEDCGTAGILNTTASLIASIQANEALKILTNKAYEKNLLRINLNNNEITKIKIKKNCQLCNETKMKSNMIIKRCKDKGGYSVKREPSKNLNLSKIKKHFKILAETPIILVLKDKFEVIVHDYGELIFKNSEEKNIGEIRKTAERIYKNG